MLCITCLERFVFLGTERVMAASGYGALSRALRITTGLCSSYGGYAGWPSQRSFSSSVRPSVIPWNEELVNKVHLVGFVGKDPVLRGFERSGSVARFTLAVHEEGRTETNWFSVDVWEERGAHRVVQHVKKGNLIYVTGQLDVRKYINQAGEDRVLARVRAFELKFVDGAPSSVKSAPSEKEIELEKKWREFFADPTKWWDNRGYKSSENAPDFKHRESKEGLWLNSSLIPSWVPSQLAALEVASMKPKV